MKPLSRPLSHGGFTPAWAATTVMLCSLLLPSSSLLAQTYAPSANDLWDISQGSVVTATSGVNSPFSDIRDMFGGTFSSEEPGNTVFADGQPAGFVHYVQWQTATPVTVGSFVLFASGDGPTAPFPTQREFAQFVLKAKSSAMASDYDLTLYTLVVTNHPYVFLDPVNHALVAPNITPVTAQYFRAEFTQYNAGNGYDGPRIIELDGFGQKAQVCDPPPSGLVSWWAAEGNANDSFGTNNGVAQGNLTYAPGEIGQAWQFDGATAAIRAPASSSLNVGTGSGFTIEGWINPADLTTPGPLLEWNNGAGIVGAHFWINVSTAIGGSGPGSIFANITDVTGYGHGVSTPPNLLSAGAFNHVAVTYDHGSGIVTLFLNGNVVAAQSFGVFTPDTTHDVILGTRATSPYYFKGLMDEMSLYNKALSAAQIQAIYLAGSAGKCAVPPVIVSEPQGQTVTAGTAATFAVGATGSQPLSYQWFVNQTNIPLATNATLMLNNVQPGESGNSYSVQMSNSAGVTNSTSALLTVNPVSCDPPPSGLVSWWAAEGNALDSAGGNNGTLVGETGFAVGEAGQAFSFNGVNQYVKIPNVASLNVSNQFTIDFWMNYAPSNPPGSIVEGLVAGDFYGIEWTPGVSGFYAYLSVDGGNSYVSTKQVNSGELTFPASQWHHVAATYDGAKLQMYLDGQAWGNPAAGTGNVSPMQPGSFLTLGSEEGRSCICNGRYYKGLLDEVDVFNRALSASEIQAIYLASSAGKCPAPPVIVSEPESQTVTAGTNVTFAVGATGSQPLSYQWSVNASNLPAATNATLVLTNVQVSQSGNNYSVQVSNLAGSTNSSSALLTVNPPVIVTLFPSTNDLWDISQGSVVTGTSGVNAPFSDIRDMFGGQFSLVELGNTVFADGEPAGFVHYVEWQTPGLVTVSNFVLFASGDGPVALFPTQREFAQFVLKAKSSPSATNYDLTLYTLVVTNHPYVFLDPINHALVAPNITPVTAQYFRAEFTQYNAGNGYDGPRIIELDGFGANSPPVIVTQPTNQTVPAGTDVTFAVGATGSQPLSYQWFVNGTNALAGDTNATLTLAGVQPGQSGNFYSVQVSNSAGSTNSSGALLTVNPASCDPAPSGLVGWWAAEGNANDSFGTNNGTLVGGAGFAPGEVGQAFNFDGVSQYVDVPSSASLNPANSLTVEAWVYEETPTQGAIIKKAGEGLAQVHGYGLEVDNPGPMLVFGVYVGGSVGWGVAYTVPLPLNQWVHVAGVYNGTNLSVYTNGVLVAAPVPVSGPIIASGNNLNIGHDSASPTGNYFDGLIDEASVYNTALTAAQIQAIYNAGSAGKCLAPPVIVSEPESQTVTAGTNVTFAVGATGSQPLNYQWFVNQTNIPLATNATLVLTNVQPGQSGNNYSVQLSNTAGSTNSSSARLTVNPPPCDSAPSGLVSWWAAEGNANDSFDTNNGMALGSLGYAAGEAGQAFQFDGTLAGIRVPASARLDVGTNGGLTIEGWIKPASLTVNEPLAEWNNGTDNWGVHFQLNQPPIWDGSGPGSLFADINDNATGASHWLASPANVLSTNSWNHVALTYDRASGVAALYVNGSAVAVQNLGSFTPLTAWDFYLGYSPQDPSFALYYYTGLIDEMSLYNVALTSDQIRAIYSAGSEGKCAVPPVIVSQPQNETVMAGNAASFSVGATGSQPLSYQWFVNQTNIPLATNATLVLNNAQLGQSGNNYSAQVSNSAGTTNSSSAQLTVNPPPCDSAPSGLVSWWAAEGNANDSFGTNNGTLQEGMSFTNGKVGQAFQFDGTTGYVRIPASPSLDVGSGVGFTVEGWINPLNVASNQPLAEWNANNEDVGIGVHLWISLPVPGAGPGSLFANLKNPANNFILNTGPGLVTNGGFQHVALTYDKPSGIATLYYNGFKVAQGTSPFPNYTPATTADLYFGKRIAETPTTIAAAGTVFGGLIDEMSLYNVALSAGQIQAIYNAGGAGKCAVPPVIVSEPQNETVVVGNAVSFSVNATGSQPLSYQWYVNASNLPAATNATLTLTNVQPVQSGNYYSVQVSNGAGVTNSGSALLTVLPPSCTPPPSGLVGWWCAEGNANDSFGTNNGTLAGGAGFAPGEVGQAFSFNGTSQYVDVPDSPALNPTASITCEAWINPSQFPFSSPIIKKAGIGGYALEIGGSQGALFGVYVNGNWAIAQYAPVPLNQWSHVAGVYDGTNVSVYLNGVLAVSAVAGPGLIVPSPNDLQIGHDPSNPSRYFKGLIDEASVYNTALSTAQIQAIYNAGSAGKCLQRTPPTITLEPVGQRVQLGCSVTFTSGATGSGTLTYQWQFNGSNLPAQTNTGLTLVDVQPANFGNYAMIASNLCGSATSSVAVLSLDRLPVPGSIVIQRFPGGGVRMNTGDILAAATDPDGDPLSLFNMATSSTAGGVVTLSGPSIYYLPPPGWTNTDSFNYTLSDGHCAGTAVGSVQVAVRGDTNPASRMTIAKMGDGSVQVIFDGMPGVEYGIQGADTLSPPDWQDITNLTADQYGTYIYTDWPATNGPVRYFRSVCP